MTEAVQTPVGTLLAHPRNSRTHSREQITALGRAIGEFGFLQPVVADEHGVVLIGHGRLEAARSIGMKTVPVITRAGLTEAKKRALLISDNRLAELGSSWDNDMLGEELRYLLEANYDLTLTAFDLPEPKPPAEETDGAEEPVVSLPGDIWLMGQHRLACGEPAEHVAAAACGPLAADLLVAGLPPEIEAAAVCASLAGYGGASCYLWHRPLDQTAVADGLEAAGFALRAQIVARWPTTRGSGDYAAQHDLCWYAVRRGVAAGWIGGRKQATLWDVEPAVHGRRPIALWRRPMVNHLKPGGVVLDTFAGRGTVFIAAHQIARTAVGVERDQSMCDKAVLRWQAHSGQEATHETSGETFASVAESRRAAA